MVIISSSNIHRTRRLEINCVFRSSLHSQVFFQVEGPTCCWNLQSGESGFMRESEKWLTNHPHLAQALEQWRENTTGTEPERHVQVKIELSKVAAFAAGPSPARSLSTTCVAECLRQARREEVQWCRGMGVWDLVLRKGMNAEGAKTVSLRWFDTDKGDAARPNYRSRLSCKRSRRS